MTVCLVCESPTPDECRLPESPAVPDLPYSLWMTRPNPDDLALPEPETSDGWLWLTDPVKWGPMCSQSCATAAAAVGLELGERLAALRRYRIIRPERPSTQRFRLAPDVVMPLMSQWRKEREISDTKPMPLAAGHAVSEYFGHTVQLDEYEVSS